MTRATRWDRAVELRDELWADTAAEPGRALTEAVLDRFRSDTLRFSDILEWSLSADAHAVDTARFSYAFPNYLRARGEVERTVIAWADALGPAVARAARSLLRAARHPAVEQVLIGYAGGGPAARTKLYLQFAREAGPEALSLARGVLGIDRSTKSDMLPLHLLGLDVGASGLAGAKLYFVEAEHPARPGCWPRPLVNSLRIHRLRAPDDPGFASASEIDFGLTENALAWDEVRSWPAALASSPGLDRFERLSARFRLRPRRVSLALDGPAKLNLYYVLDEAQ
jgi:hypothetical protein